MATCPACSSPNPDAARFRMARAEALSLAGREPESRAASAEARAIWAGKGHRAGVRWAETWLA